MAETKRKRDYHAEYERRKANGWVRPPRDHHAEYESRKAAGYKPDYAAIYQKEKESGKYANQKRFVITLPDEDARVFTCLYESFGCKSANEFVKKILNEELRVLVRKLTKKEN